MKTIKVTHIINNLDIGGAEKLLLSLAKEQITNPQLEVEVVSLEGHGSLEKEFLKAGIKVTNFNLDLFHHGVFRKLVKLFDFYFSPKLFNHLRQNKPDILHGHLLVGEDFAKVAGKLLEIPVICTVHDVLFKQGYKQRFLNSFLSAAVAVSPEVKEHIIKDYHMRSDKVVVIPNAIDFDTYKSGKKVFNPGKPVFTYIGRITSGKGIEYAAEGLAHLVEKFPGLIFEIYGKGVESFDEEKLKKLIVNKEWNFVRFMGVTDDVPKALARGDVFILPSESEGFSLVALEASAAYKPIISTRVGITEEIIIDGKTGYFVDYGSDSQITEMATKILKSDIETMGKQSHDYNVGRFSIENSAKLYYNLYLKVLKNV